MTNGTDGTHPFARTGPKFLTYLMLALIVACILSMGVTASQKADQNTNDDAKADALFEAYFQENLALYPFTATQTGDHRYDDQLAITISDAHRAKQKTFALRYVAALGKLDAAGLSPDRKLSADLLAYTLQQQLDLLKFPDHLMPINSMSNFPDGFATMGEGGGDHPFKTVRDFENFQKRMQQFGPWVDTAIANMRKGMAAGVVTPRVVTERVIGMVKAHVVDSTDQSKFVVPLKNLPDDMSASEQAAFAGAYRETITEDVIPAYARLAAFMKDEYLPASRTTVAWHALPNGKAWYNSYLQFWTTTDMTAEQIHSVGLQEVKRIKHAYDAANEAAKAAPPADSYGTESELIAAYNALLTRINPQLDALFGFRPETPFIIKGTHLGTHYRPGTADGTRPGMFMLSTGYLDKEEGTVSEALFIHEAIPGHHYQIALQKEADLPAFRQNLYMYAYIEGWGLYAESLGETLGLYKTPTTQVDRLYSELFRAIRLVVDTGMHAKGWTIEQAADYFDEAMGFRPQRELVRYVSWPGQALTYKIGELKIIELRDRLKAKQGSAFDIRDFHRRVLMAGPVPLAILEQLLLGDK